MERLVSIAAKAERIVIGLNSGTSMDGVDALLVRIAGAGVAARPTPLAFLIHPYPEGLRTRLLRAPALDLEETTRLHVEVAEAFAQAAASVAAKAGLKLSEVDLVGSHGQTVCHLPSGGRGEPTATLQIGDLDVIAERTGVVTVGDFRARDVAAGGEGAPLMPYLDWLLYRDRPRTVCLNLGGIANVTLVAADLESCLAFDAGPANLALDLLASRLTQGREHYDPGGRLAEQGTIDPVLLEKLMAHPFLHKPPPRSTGREMFGAAYVEDLLARNSHLALRDILATSCAFVARAVHHAVATWLAADGGPREIVVSGGGVHNLTLLRHLKHAFFPVPVTPSSEHGTDPDAKEALLFAVLANERLAGGPANVPSATGARWPVSLGKVTW